MFWRDLGGLTDQNLAKQVHFVVKLLCDVVPHTQNLRREHYFSSPKIREGQNLLISASKLFRTDQNPIISIFPPSPLPCTQGWPKLGALSLTEVWNGRKVIGSLHHIGGIDLKKLYRRLRAKNPVVRAWKRVQSMKIEFFVIGQRFEHIWVQEKGVFEIG